MVELDELNLHLKAKLGQVTLSTEQEPATYPISQGFSSSGEQNPTKNNYSWIINPVNPDPTKQTETVNLNKGLYTEQSSGTVDRYLGDDFNNSIPKCPVVSEETHEEKDEFFSSGQTLSAQLHYEKVDRSDYLFTAHPIGHLSSAAVPPPEEEYYNDDADLTAFDTEPIQIFTQQVVVENLAQTEPNLEELQEIPLGDDKDFEEFKTSSGEFGKERFYVDRDVGQYKDGSDFEIDEDEENVVIPRIMNDIPYISDQPQTLVSEEQDHDVNPGVTSERELLGNILHNPTDKKPPDGLGTVPKLKFVSQNNSVDLISDESDTLEIPDSHDIFHNSTELFHAENDQPKIGKHIMFEEKPQLDTEPVSPYLPPDDIVTEQNAETMIDEVLSANNSTLQEERLSSSSLAVKSLHPNANQPLSKPIHDTKMPTNKKGAEFSNKENYQNKPGVSKLANQHPVNKILHTNFFLPLTELERSMKAVKLSTAIKTYKSAMVSSVFIFLFLFLNENWKSSFH